MNNLTVVQTFHFGKKSIPLYLLLFLFLSCHSALVKGQDAPLKKPTEAFIAELKLLNEGKRADDVRYDFREVDFKGFEPVTITNLFEEYADLLHLSEDFELRHVFNTTTKMRGSDIVYDFSRYHPYYKGILVDWQEPLAYHKDGIVALVASYIPSELDIDIDNRISEEKAQTLFKAYLEEKGYNYFEPGGGFRTELRINQKRLAYRFTVDIFTPRDRFEVYMDAKDGNIYYEESTQQDLAPKIKVKSEKVRVYNENDNAILTECLSGNYNTNMITTQTLINGNQSISIQKCEDAEVYRLFDEYVGLPMEEEPILAINTYEGLVNNMPPFINSDPIVWCTPDFNNMNDEMKEEANAYYAAEFAYKYYLNNYNILSFDGSGSSFKLALHDPAQSDPIADIPSNSARWDEGDNFIQLGDGIAGICNIMGTVEVISHELTHGYLNNYYSLDSGNNGVENPLLYSTRAIHEALCDIVGTIMHYRSDNNPANIDWSFGDTGCSDHSAFPRLFNDPQNSKIPQAAYYEDTNFGWTDDETEIYTRAGVIIHWFYLITDGGTGVLGTPVNALGIDTSRYSLLP